MWALSQKWAVNTDFGIMYLACFLRLWFWKLHRVGGRISTKSCHNLNYLRSKLSYCSSMQSKNRVKNILHAIMANPIPNHRFLKDNRKQPATSIKLAITAIGDILSMFTRLFQRFSFNHNCFSFRHCSHSNFLLIVSNLLLK